MITANDISTWAETRSAQGELPRLVRRLIGRFGSVTALAMPAGDSVHGGGFDGEISAKNGTAWIPEGKSIWELSVEKGATNKANRDYSKRAKEISKKDRKKITYIAVTARKWPTKTKWLNAKKKLNEWADIRVIDADDLEAWLESEPAVQIWFAEQLGKTTFGLKSVEAYWVDWNRDVVPSITQEAVLSGRENAVTTFFKLLEERKSGGTIVIHADSSEEAAAFACASLLNSKECGLTRAVVISSSDAWPTVFSNTGIEVAVAAQTIVAVDTPAKNDLVVVIPFATGESEAHFPGHPKLDTGPDICLQRIYPEDFHKSLEDLGVEKGDAERLTLQCGRSWSVYRRLKNNNPAQRQPTWHDQKYKTVLTTMALVGGFQIESDADRKVIEFISEESFDNFEKELRQLILTDDAPIVQINGVIKAKAPLELFKLNESGISNGVLDRFFTISEQVLSQRDPQLDLEREDRWLSQIKGKIRPESGALIHSLSDSLARLGALATDDTWQWKVSNLVKNLLSEADKERWFSVSRYLSQLAEASPDDFLAALELDLSQENPAVFTLFEETESAGHSGACWYSDLLWALEMLAWAPNRLVRVARVLASLAKFTIKSNWANSPKSSLLNIFRGWLPQTCAPIEMRISAIEALVKTHQDQAFNLCMGILHRGHDMASPSPRPKWREDDAGHSNTVTDAECVKAMKHAAKTAFKLAGASPDRACELFERYNIFDKPYKEEVLNCVGTALRNSTIESGRGLRNALRRNLYWERNHREGTVAEIEANLKPVQHLYDDTEPSDLLEKHRWLFTNYYCELPEREGRRTSSGANDRVSELRLDALKEICGDIGFDGFYQLHLLCGDNSCVGQSIHLLNKQIDELLDWAINTFSDEHSRPLLQTWIRTFNDENRDVAVKKVLYHGHQTGWKDSDELQFLSLAQSEPTTWKIVAGLKNEQQSDYWQSQYTIPSWLDGADRKCGVSKLLEFDNVAGALRSLRYHDTEFEGIEIAEILERNFASENHALNDLSHHEIGDLIEAMEKSDALDRQRLLLLEFQMVVSFGQFVAELMIELQNEILTDPEQLFFMITKVYKADKATKIDPDEHEMKLINACGHMLMYTKRIPGLNKEGQFDEAVFKDYSEKLLSKAKKEGYVKGTQIVFGELLAYAPETENGQWPPACVCKILDYPEYETMRSTFNTGARNKRGITSRSPYDGGEQERALAEEYQIHADACQIDFPLASHAISQIAEGYRRHATRHDRDSETSKERF